MRPDLQLVRLMAAMIVMIIAYVAPSAVQAHEGHAHHARQHVAVERVQAAPVAVQVLLKPLTSVSTQPQATAGRTAVSVAMVGLIQADEQGRGCCPGPCKGTCCGTMSCCISGTLSGPAPLPILAFGRVVLVSRDMAGLPGVDPKTLPKPPRTLA